jgi:hypothetical protein
MPAFLCTAVAIKRTNVYGKIRANHTAGPAAGAFFRSTHTGNIVAFGVRFVRAIENVLLAEFNAQATAFASFRNNVNAVFDFYFTITQAVSVSR